LKGEIQIIIVFQDITLTLNTLLEEVTLMVQP